MLTGSGRGGNGEGPSERAGDSAGDTDTEASLETGAGDSGNGEGASESARDAEAVLESGTGTGNAIHGSNDGGASDSASDAEAVLESGTGSGNGSEAPSNSAWKASNGDNGSSGAGDAEAVIESGTAAGRPGGTGDSVGYAESVLASRAGAGDTLLPCGGAGD